MVGLFGYVAGGAMEGLGTGIVAEAQAKREEMLEALAQDRLDRRQQMVNDAAMQRLERTAELESGARREAAKLNSQTAIATEERDRRNADRDFQRERQTRAKIGTPVEPTERARTTLDIFKALDPGRNRNDLAGLLGGDVSDMPDTANMSVEERWAMAERLTERLYPSGRGPARRGEDGPGAAAARGDGPDKNAIMDDAMEALANGAPRAEVEAVLRANGIDPARLPAAATTTEPPSPREEESPARPGRPPASQADRYGGEMRGAPRPRREPVRGQAEDGWSTEPIQGESADILGGAVRAVGSAARAVGDALRPNPGGILTEEAQRRRGDEEARRRAGEAQRFRPRPEPEPEPAPEPQGPVRSDELLSPVERRDLPAGERVRAATQRQMGQRERPTQERVDREARGVIEDRMAEITDLYRRGEVTFEYYRRQIARLRRELGRLEGED